MSVKTYCKGKEEMMGRINARRKKKTYKLSPEDIEKMQNLFIKYTMPDNLKRDVFTRAVQGYLESFETTETKIRGFDGRKMDLRDGGLYYALQGRVQEAIKYTNFGQDTSYQNILLRTAERMELLNGSTLIEIGKGIPVPSSVLDWVELCRTLDRAVSTGQLQLQDGKYSLVNAGGESKDGK